MYNWSVDLKKFCGNLKNAKIWRLEQTINFGLNGDKLNRKSLKEYWNKLRIDPSRRSFLRFLLWPKKS